MSLPQEIILDMFFELLNIKTPAWYKAFINGRRLTGMSYHAKNVNGTTSYNGSDSVPQVRPSLGPKRQR